MILKTRPQNLFQFSIEELRQQTLSLKTKPQSLAFGRRLYRFEKGQQIFWLKAQLYHQNFDYETGFLNELNFYQSFFEQNQFPDFLLPFQIIDDGIKLEPVSELINISLVLPDCPSIFNDVSHSSINDVQTTLLQLLESLDQLHQLGWIHGDLKAEHFLKYEQRVCLIDFEQVQKISTRASQQTLTATPHYMAPELFQGQGKTVQSDIYALGIIIYEWLTGLRLTAKNYTDWAYLHCQRLNIDLPKQFSRFEYVVQRMLAKQKQDRFTDISSIKYCLMIENV